MTGNWLGKFHQLLLKTEAAMLVALFVMMVLLSVMQIILRNFWGGGLIWAEPLTRIIVLWITLMGAMIASRKNQHIAIDVVVKKLSDRFRIITIRISSVFTAMVCFVVAWYSFQFVHEEYNYGGMVLANIPDWVCEAIIPVAFFIMAIRYLLAAMLADLQKQS